jgi:hypothetical protein
MGYLNEYTRRRVAAILLVAGIVVGVLAITDAPPLFDDPPTRAELAEEAMRKFFAAGAEEDFERVCSLMTQQERQSWQNPVIALAAGLKDEKPSCPDALEAVAKDELADAELELLEVSVSGSQARIEIKRRIEGEGRLQRTVLLQEVEGRWRIDDPGLQQTG